MALINYKEAMPAELSGVILALGIVGAIAYVLLLIERNVRPYYEARNQYFETETKYNLLETIYLERKAKKLGVDLEDELQKRRQKQIQQDKAHLESEKTIRQKVVEQMEQDLVKKGGNKP